MWNKRIVEGGICGQIIYKQTTLMVWMIQKHWDVEPETPQCHLWSHKGSFTLWIRRTPSWWRLKGEGAEYQEKEFFKYTLSIWHKQYESCYPRGALTENYSSKAGLGNGSSHHGKVAHASQHVCLIVGSWGEYVLVWRFLFFLKPRFLHGHNT